MFCKLLNTYSNSFLLDLGRQLLGFVVRWVFDSNESVRNGLVDFYGKCKVVGFTETVLYRINEKHDISWCSIVVVDV